MARPALEQQIDHGLVAFRCRPSDHISVVQVAVAVDVRAGVEQEPHALEEPVGGCQVQWA